MRAYINIGKSVWRTSRNSSTLVQSVINRSASGRLLTASNVTTSSTCLLKKKTAHKLNWVFFYFSHPIFALPAPSCPASPPLLIGLFSRQIVSDTFLQINKLQ
jgi:hypothetical protein